MIKALLKAPRRQKARAGRAILEKFLTFPYFLSLIFLGTFFFANPLHADDNRLMISGSTTVLPLTEAAAELFMKDNDGIQLSVSGTGTGEGIKSLVDGNVDIAGASRDLLPAEIVRAKSLEVPLIRHTVALDSLAVVVHPDNPLTGLTLDQLEKIYIGEIKNWSELGSFDRPIIAINRDSSSGTFEMWLKLVLKGKRYRRDAQVQPSGGGITYAVGGNRNAIGYVGVGFLNPRVKVLEINGVLPSLENVANGSYPLSRELYMFTRDPVPDTAKLFLDFLGSPTGRDIITETGFLPPPVSK
ncbi:MAG: phosphate ABC transporter substrate-binding protein [Deltaproteobacteria bacterium]|jgi:phosphate transport system substrate-binding protein|nr:phosphate ABC transporter substrate-binding protein [Deltaproteobacteria bacterium]